MPEDNRDFRIRCDLTFPLEEEGVARGLINHLSNQMDKAVNINPGDPFAEPSYCSLEHCGHRLGLLCEKLEEYWVE